VCNMYGRIVRMGKTMALKPSEEFRKYERKLLRHIVQEFMFLWSEHERLEQNSEEPTEVSF